MAKQDVSFTLPERKLGKTDVEFYAYNDGKKIGTMKVSNGTIEWKPAKKSKTSYHLTWAGFAKMMEENGWTK